MLVAILSLQNVNISAQEIEKNIEVSAQETQQDMEEVKLTDLPEAVIKTLAEKYPKQTPVKALKAKKNNTLIYYIKLKQGEEFETVMIDKAGNVVAPENKRSE